MPFTCFSFRLSFLFLAASFSFLTTDSQGEVVQEWNELLLSSLAGLDSLATPPDNARSLAMVSLSVYEATNSITQTHESYLGSYQNYSGSVSMEIAAAKAAHDTLIDLYGWYLNGISHGTSFDTISRHAETLLNSHIATYGGGDATLIQNSLNLGGSASAGIISARANDGFQGPQSYTPPAAAPGVWQPVTSSVSNRVANTPTTTTFMAYHAVNAQPFGMNSGSQFRPAPPPALTSAAYTSAYNEVKDYGSLTSSIRTSYQTETAHFWADGTGTESPPGHWNSIAQAVSGGLTTAEKARLFALLNIANADVAIATWEAKDYYHLWRPDQAINALDDTNPDTVQDSTWRPLIGTPPFPAYTSGHSGFSNASAEILELYFGTDNIAFTTESTNPNLQSANGDPMTRSYISFSDAALEAGQSRIYGGIHFQFDNEAGRELGENVANYTYNNFLRPVAVPEPGSALLVVLSSLCVALRRERRVKQSNV
jgi:hypothetical protein